MTPPTRLCSLALAASLIAGTAAAQDGGDTLRRNEALLMFDYQVIKVPGDAPIDLLGFHLHSKVGEGLYLGAGVYAPHVKGEYGGFMAFDVGAHYRHRLVGKWFVTADASVGGGGGGRTIEQSTELSGTGGFAKASLGLGYDFGPFLLGLSATRMKFRESLIDSTQANVFLTIPYSYLTGAFGRHGEPLSADEDRRTGAEMGENMLTVTLDNFQQIDPQGSNKDTIRTADLQFSHFFSRDSYWFGALGVGYSGLPIYNQMLGGVGRRVRLARDLNAYGQIGLGSGGYAPELIDTGPGLLVYPKLAVEYEITRSLGLALSAGYLAAPKATSRNWTWGLALIQHLRSGDTGDASASATWRGFRVSIFHQTEMGVRYRDIDRENLQMIGLQIDTPLGGPWYLPLQAAVATSDYLGYPGYGELLAGIGLESQIRPGPASRLQWFGQVMGGANVHGLGLKAGGGLRWILDDRLSLHLAVGAIETRKSDDRRFTAHSVGVGLDYRFAVPMR
jgi:hypothetical protein